MNNICKILNVQIQTLATEFKSTLNVGSKFESSVSKFLLLYGFCFFCHLLLFFVCLCLSALVCFCKHCEMFTIVWQDVQ